MHDCHEHHHGSHHDGRSCGCGSGGGEHRFQRRFSSPQEKAARLKEYLADLNAEAAEVAKRIKELKQA